MAIAREQDRTSLEHIILTDIEQRTGLTFRKLGGIDTRNNRIAEVVLPVLVEWPDRIEELNHRHAIYACFHTPYAYPYLEKLILWWRSEQNEIGLASLTQTLALIIKSSDAERVWTLCQELPRRPFHFMLLAKLATFPTTECQVKDAIGRALTCEPLRAGDLAYIAEVRDPRVRQWFEGQVDSPDRAVRAIAERVVSRLKDWPKELAYARSGPERTRELFSTEADIEGVPQLIKKLVKQFNLRIPSSVQAGAFLSQAEIDRWIVSYIAATDGRKAAIWFRLEDVDTVEVVLLHPSD